MITVKFKMAALLAISTSFLLGGCASFNVALGGMDYPADTAILIGDVAYRINTVKCAQIKGIGENGALDCYDSENRQSASIAPVGESKRKFLKEKTGIEWASPEHQTLLFNFYHGGGKEQAMGELISSTQQAYGTLAAAKNISNSLKKSREIELQSAQMKIKGAEAYMSGGMPAWQAHQLDVMQWRLDNSSYFINQMNKSNP